MNTPPIRRATRLTTITLDERKRLLKEGLQTLGERERAAIVLRDIEGLSTQEVAKILGVEEVTVRSQISVARGEISEICEETLMTCQECEIKLGNG